MTESTMHVENYVTRAPASSSMKTLISLPTSSSFTVDIWWNHIEFTVLGHILKMSSRKKPLPVGRKESHQLMSFHLTKSIVLSGAVCFWSCLFILWSFLAFWFFIVLLVCVFTVFSCLTSSATCQWLQTMTYCLTWTSQTILLMNSIPG